MSQPNIDSFEQNIRRAGEEWMIDWYTPHDQAVSHLLQTMAEAAQWSRDNFGNDGPRLTPETIGTEFSQNPHKVKAFLQILSSARTPQILVMVWQILQGWSIEFIRFEYQAEEKFILDVHLVAPLGTEKKMYRSIDIDDAVILRHLGIMKINDKGIFDGFYALNLRGTN